MKSYAFDVVRSHIPTMDLDEAYADADTIAKHIQDTLQTQMADYGYEIIKALITNIEPDQRVKDAMNNINAARRNQEAATAQGEGDKTLRIKKAEAESESMRLHGEGVAAEREAIAQGLKDSLAILADQQGIDPKEAMGLVALTQYMDTIRSVGEHGNMTTLLLPHSPASVGSLMDQVQQGMLTGNLAADAARSGGNGAGGTRAADVRQLQRRRALGPRAPARRLGRWLRTVRAWSRSSGLPLTGGCWTRTCSICPRPSSITSRPMSTERHDRLVAAGSLMTGVTLIGGCALLLYGGWQLLFNGGGAFSAVVAVIGLLLAATHWGWVHVAEYVGLTIDAHQQREIEARELRWLATIQPYPRFSVSTSVLDDASTRVERILHRPVLTEQHTFTFVRQTDAETDLRCRRSGRGDRDRRRDDAPRRRGSRPTVFANCGKRRRPPTRRRLLSAEDEQQQLAAQRAAATALSEHINASLLEPPLVE